MITRTERTLYKFTKLQGLRPKACSTTAHLQAKLIYMGVLHVNTPLSSMSPITLQRPNNAKLSAP